MFFSDSTRKLFNDEGIVKISFLNEHEITSLIEIYKSTSEDISDSKFHSTMFINNAVYRKQIDAAIRKIILPKINSILNSYKLLFANFIVKEPSAETAVGIHQDWNFTSPDYTSVNIWIPLVDIDEQTGLFYALKGSQRIFTNIRYTPYESDRYKEIESSILNNSTSFKIKAGDALIYHGALIHYSEPNISNKLRIAVGGAIIPSEAPNLHYYKRDTNRNELEVYEVTEEFYHSFNFFDEPKGVRKLSTVKLQPGIPTFEELKALM
jgi:ectoine hydroxylase-related dioxygenase (phytanoyl-CoA dioxygenase family)